MLVNMMMVVCMLQLILSVKIPFLPSNVAFKSYKIMPRAEVNNISRTISYLLLAACRMQLHMPVLHLPCKWMMTVK